MYYQMLRKDFEISCYTYGFFLFSLRFCLVYFNALQLKLYVFLLNGSFYHLEMPPFIPANYILPKAYFDVKIATSTVLQLVFVCCIPSKVALVVKSPPANTGGIRDVSSVPGSGRSLGRGRGNPLHYSCLENPMDRVILWATVHRITKSWTRLKRLSTHPHVVYYFHPFT